VKRKADEQEQAKEQLQRQDAAADDVEGAARGFDREPRSALMS